ncbi:FAA hydrolase family protein [Haloferax mediterranei ATCC 33500]|uniref:2-hydroxyhepta-2,4-diene-1, 7-dioate isomerase n=1 Tax=Haloferax mediterranei (strain ATCC 33500 / DSM 1411 / JCM 8866 / NBRC 14739 / NCIMB 2177 / R-4) TaxID=523841 RepID=I3R6W9_HALMT|nr:fumarylacetoacetate hydrolase family protein [Haloferax mediterranei]AFK19979.1 2-hydroxyhepta-24-diene-1,7-dioate isomerase [Haloferax mediterranei ATCC 33500]AHZ23357.1 fumarylacetoacetase [Haloferax mediterranei ATCC 33500]ELZ99525.1 2-hydroxyhepta-2,4-diene-1, 7-dioate isomerase [Haloferax mediterranei ATCC 33500]MDX5987269.1 fumarylacetoacetate hydrolase family protein [Haloferax mediterranei ATCC 33500]QCQ73791.1 FAA hydrolase family protein [Haloferax mediterranei ATCC 33500]
MRLARIRTDDGVLAGEYDDGVVAVGTDQYEVGVDAELLAPCGPSALYCVGRNYAATVDQMEYEIPDQPDWFIKPPVSVLDPGSLIEYPAWTEELTYAGELAAVIDCECSNVDEADVPDVVRGYTILNDLDALDQPGRTARKAFDGSGPLGPWIETAVDPSNLDMTTHVGGELRQEANTEQMLFSPAEVVSFLSERYTFQPGDVVSFGSPANPGLIEPGDEVEIWYEGIGTLTNRVAEKS